MGDIGGAQINSSKANQGPHLVRTDPGRPQHRQTRRALALRQLASLVIENKAMMVIDGFGQTEQNLKQPLRRLSNCPLPVLMVVLWVRLSLPLVSQPAAAGSRSAVSASRHVLISWGPPTPGLHPYIGRSSLQSPPSIGRVDRAVLRLSRARASCSRSPRRRATSSCCS